jgi:hypothetical protein
VTGQVLPVQGAPGRKCPDIMARKRSGDPLPPSPLPPPPKSLPSAPTSKASQGYDSLQVQPANHCFLHVFAAHETPTVHATDAKLTGGSCREPAEAHTHHLCIDQHLPATPCAYKQGAATQSHEIS